MGKWRLEGACCRERELKGKRQHQNGIRGRTVGSAIKEQSGSVGETAEMRTFTSQSHQE